MMSLKQRIIEMARKWQKKTASGRIISYPTIRRDSSSWATNKGHFVVYSMDQKRFVVPIEYLSKKVVKELLSWSEEEFGPERNGPITLPIDGTMLEYVISLVAEHVTEDVEKALISISSNSSCSSHHLHLTQQPIIIYGF
ncbi:hypothetical protein K1719_000776 [Acacia pycnantha]|nr:hypothetical protein K1719_000776 [Acacia pycnantha]